MGWDVDDAGLFEVLTRVHEEYPPVPLYVTENGAAFDDVLSVEGAVHDPERESPTSRRTWPPATRR